MSIESTVNTPGAKWAQRNNVIYFTICVEDCTDPIIKIEQKSLHFHAIGGADKKTYDLTVDFYDEISPEASTQIIQGRDVEFTLKKVKEGFWPRLTKGTTKHHWLKVDFNKWKEEDESDEETRPGGGFGGGGGGDMDFEKMMREMGGLGGGAGGKASLDDLHDDPETDSDDEAALPELE